jgi:uncharacterized Zn finger protein
MDPIPGIIADIQKALQGVLERTRAVRTLLEGAEEGRKARAKQVLVTGRVKWVTEGPNPKKPGILIRSLVEGSGGEPYLVSIALREGLGVGRVSCDCRDFGRTSSCKHVLAVVGKYVLESRAQWQKLKNAAETLAG